MRLQAGMRNIEGEWGGKNKYDTGSWWSMLQTKKEVDWELLGNEIRWSYLLKDSVFGQPRIACENNKFLWNESKYLEA